MADSHARLAVLVESATRPTTTSRSAINVEDKTASRTETSTLAEFFATTGPEDIHNASQIPVKPRRSIAALEFLRIKKSAKHKTSAHKTPTNVTDKTTTEGVRYHEIKAIEQSDAVGAVLPDNTTNVFVLAPPVKHGSVATNSTSSNILYNTDARLSTQTAGDNSWASSLSTSSYDHDLHSIEPRERTSASTSRTMSRKLSARIENEDSRPRPGRRVSGETPKSSGARNGYHPQLHARTMCRTQSGNTAPRRESAKGSFDNMYDVDSESDESNDSELSLTHSLKLLKEISDSQATPGRRVTLGGGYSHVDHTSSQHKRPETSETSAKALDLGDRHRPRVIPSQSFTGLLRKAAANQSHEPQTPEIVRGSIEHQYDQELRRPADASDVLLYGQMEHTITSGAPILLYKQTMSAKTTAKIAPGSAQNNASIPLPADTANVARDEDTIAARLESLEQRNRCLEEALTFLLADRSARLA